MISSAACGTIEQKKAGYAAVETKWNTGELFADPANLKWLNSSAVKRDQQSQLDAATGKQNIANAYGVGEGTDDLKSAAKSLEMIASGKTGGSKDVAGPQTTTQTADMKAPVDAIRAGLSTELTTQSGAFTAAGAQLFGYVGQGFVDQAKSSGILARAVQAMVLSLLPKAP